MQCFVYRSQRKKGTYLFTLERDDFSKVPESLMNLFGTPEFSFAFELTPERKLIQADAQQVEANLKANGFFLQMPPGDERFC
ncbi:YcgL domain-containing protein [Thiolinea disciformis]|uniref:YcgL domain-containing protein n=1 Tax=Thiolinea disciformis TaxID=125614 RepID=UPI000369A0F8|nr:YcgL domain-containing protein [Thiolinea disciformis]